MTETAERLAIARARIAAAAARVGRSPDEITLVAVTKGVSAARVLEAVELGVRHFGENRVQEAAQKIPAVVERTPSPLRWHMVGHLQTNKARNAVRLFDIIHSVDSVRLATVVDREARRAGRVVPVLIEVNFSSAPGRFGVAPEKLVDLARVVASLPNLQAQGLMTVAPLGLNLEETRAVFRRLRALLEQLRETVPSERWSELSMGMSDDFELAIEEGATMVRLGRAIFGERQ